MNRSFRASRLALLLCASLCVYASPALAQSDTGEITITVVDANTKSPVVDARTILIGPQTASSLTTKAGVIHYTDVPTGIYRVRVVKRGFDSGASKEFDVLDGRSVSVRVELSTSTGGLKIIGSVTARSNVSVSSSDISDNSPIRRISNSLTDALDTIAGVTVTQDATDPTSAVTVSLTNHDESQTAITLDGIPLSAPGTSANLRGIGTDLFSGSSVSNSPSAGALGGGVNFRTLEPTQALQIHSLGTTGTFDRSNYSVAATGSVDSLGFAIQHTWRGSNSPLTFQDYEDQSGLTYPHEGESTSLGDYVKFRYRLNDDRTSISGTALSNNLDATAVCARDVTILPCGIGPGNQNYGRFGFGYATVQSLIGTVATTFSGYTSSSVQTNDDVNRYVLEPPCDISTIGQTACDPGDDGYEEDLFPSLTTNDTLTRGIAYSSSISQGRHSLTLSGNTYASLNSSVPIAGSKFEVPFTTAISSTSYTFSDSFKSSDKLTLQPRVSVVNTTTLGTSALAGFGATWAPTAANSFTSSINVGSSQPNININRSYSDPVSARFDCQAKTAIVSGPGDTNGGSQSAVSLDAAWTHRFASGSSVTADLFSQVQTGQLITAAIEEPASYYASEAGYLTDLTAAYQSPSVCGAGSGVPTVYAQESVGGTRRIYQGINLTGRFGLGRYVVALPTYSLNKAELTAASSRLDDGPSTTVVGAQLPNRPLHRAGITFDGLLPRSGIELIGNAQYTGANNQQNIGPFVTVAAGISHQFGPGQATLFENNVFNTYGGDFATDSFAAPLPLSNGGVFRTAGTPLTPRTINLSYAVNLGGPRPGPAIASVRNLAQARPEPMPSASAAPARTRFVPVPPPPGTDPLSLATTRSECDATAQTAAKPVFDALRAYVAAYEAKTKLPDVTNFTIAAHLATADPSVPYYLELRPRRPQGAANANEAGSDNGARGGRFGGERGGFGGGGGGGPEGPPPGEGGPGGGPPGGGAPPGAASGGGAPTDAQRAAFRNSPQAVAYRAFTSCAYISVFTASEAKAKGVVPQGGRPGLFYVPKTGLTFVRPPELPQGGGSLKQ
jgi:hypothetical protein